MCLLDSTLALLEMEMNEEGEDRQLQDIMTGNTFVAKQTTFLS